MKNFFAFISTIREPTFRFRLAVLSLLTIIIGMFVSRAMMSIGIILIGLQFILKEKIGETFRIYYKDKVLSLLSLIVLIYFMGIFYTDHMDEFWRKLTMKLPLVLMPLGFSALKEMPKRYFQHVLYVFVILSFIVAADSSLFFIINYSTVVESYKFAKVIPNRLDINHIRFSIMLVMAIFSTGYLIREKYFLVKSFERYFLLFAGGFIFVFLHVLSVRTGLLAFYTSCFVLTIGAAFIHKKYFLGAVVAVFIMIMPVIAYYTVPTVKNKVDYMAIDVGRFVQGQDVNYWSDGNRLLSLKIGIEIGKTSPVVGVGSGDVFDDMVLYYKKHHRNVFKEFRLIPHNQFVYIFAACGLVGLAVFLFVTLYPFFLSVTYRSIVFLALLVTSFTSYLSEATLETQLGVCIFITFYTIGWYCKPESKPEQA